MTMYDDLQAEHRALLEQREAGSNSDELRVAVAAYIRRVRSEARHVSNPRNRDQLRANLRFWASFLYDQTGTYPETTLSPSSGFTLTAKPVLGGPSRWLFWGTAVVILVFLVSIVVVAFLNVADQISLSMPSTAINELVTQIQSQQTVSARQSTQTAAAPRTPTPSSTPTVTATPRLSTTPDILRTFVSESTQAAATDFAGTATAEQQTYFPTTGGGENARLALLPTIVAQASPLGCGGRSIQVGFALSDTSKIQNSPAFSETVATITSRDLQVSVIPAGGGRTIGSNSRPDDAGDVNELKFNLAGYALSASTYLVHVEHSTLTVADVIVQFPEDCSQDEVEITYTWGLVSSLSVAELTRDANLSLRWDLLTWGPTPQIQQGSTAPVWVALLSLKAQGGDGRYVFWNFDPSAGTFDPLSESLLTITGYAACEPARTLVGVTSGGVTVTREILIYSPLCIQKR